MEARKNLKQITAVAGIFVLSVIFLNYGSRWLYQLAFRMYPLYKGIDPEDAFMYLFLHHIFQGIFFLLLIALACRLMRRKWRDFGFNLNAYRFSLLYSLCFLLFWTALQFTLGYLMVRNGSVFDMSYTLNARNFTGYFLFEILLSGSSEELFFRAFIISITSALLKDIYQKQRWADITAIMISTLLFMVGHIQFELFPFRITYFDLMQQLTVVACSLAYGVVFLKTKSLLAPILIHNLLNGVATISTIVLYQMSH